MQEESFIEQAQLAPRVRIILTVWCIILVPWLLFFTLVGSGLAFDAGNTPAAYLTASILWAYPVLVGIAYIFRRKQPKLLWLPVLPLLFIVAACFQQPPWG
jgi:hypothetical protein